MPDMIDDVLAIVSSIPRPRLSSERERELEALHWQIMPQHPQDLGERLFMLQLEIATMARWAGRLRAERDAAPPELGEKVVSFKRSA
jgi:hypothetical protein